MNRDEAMVETYRDILRLKAGLAESAPVQTGPTPGTGRNCVPGRHVPGKWLRNQHRHDRRGMSLRAFARALAGQRIEGFRGDLGDLAVATARRWLAGKGARP